MSILPIVKWCTNKNTMALFTRRNLIKSSTVFKLNSDSNNGSTVQTGPTTQYTLGRFMHTSESPTCRLYGSDVIAQVDMMPGDELTYDPKQTNTK